jgi:hypothetical protein
MICLRAPVFSYYQTHRDKLKRATCCKYSETSVFCDNSDNYFFLFITTLMITLPQPIMLQDWYQDLHSYTLWQANLFYDKQSQFSNKAATPKKIRHIRKLPEHIFRSTSIIRTLANLDKGSLPTFSNSSHGHSRTGQDSTLLPCTKKFLVGAKKLYTKCYRDSSQNIPGLRKQDNEASIYVSVAVRRDAGRRGTASRRPEALKT